MNKTSMTKCPCEQSDSILVKKGWVWCLLDKTIRCHLFSKACLPFYIRYQTFIASGDNTNTTRLHNLHQLTTEFHDFFSPLFPLWLLLSYFILKLLTWVLWYWGVTFIFIFFPPIFFFLTFISLPSKFTSHFSVHVVCVIYQLQNNNKWIIV